MAMIQPFQGSLFAEDFLREAITELGDWRDLDDEALADFETVLRGLFNRFPTDLTPNESQTEEDLILTERPCLERLDAMPFDDIAAEGYAGEYESVEDFIAATFPNAKPSDEWAVVRFEFQP